MACRENIILRQIKQRNTNLLAGEFAWFDHKFRPRLRRPYFNSFARDTQSILVFNSGALARAKRARSVPLHFQFFSACCIAFEYLKKKKIPQETDLEYTVQFLA